MARRTKSEAQATRSHILDTAEIVFAQRGVSRTSLHELALAAGVSRGAIYWHFKDKADLFNAMMERVTLPLEGTGRPCIDTRPGASLAQMRDSFVDVLRKMVTDPQLRRVFEIATHKVEYVHEMRAVRERHLSMRNACWADAEQRFARAMRRGELARRLPARAAAVGLHALIDGLIQNWMLDPDAFDLVRVGRQVLDTYLASLALPAP